jgi:PKD repeat protein
MNLEDVIRDETGTIIPGVTVNDGTVTVTGEPTPDDLVMEIDPVTQSVAPGGTVFVDVLVDSDTYDVLLVDLTIDYDASAFTYAGYTYNGLLGSQLDVLEIVGGDADTFAYTVTRKAGNTPAMVDGSLITVEFDVDAGATPGDYTMNLEDVIRDETGTIIPGVTVNDGTVTVTGEPTPLEADADGPYYGSTSTPLGFSGTATGGTGTYTWDWDFGDTTAHSSQQNPAHSYAAPGNYTVTLTVTDNGDTDIDTTYAVIEEAPVGPTIKVQPSTKTVSPGDSFDITIYVNSNTSDLLLVDLQLHYDNTVFTFDGYTYEGLLGSQLDVLEIVGGDADTFVYTVTRKAGNTPVPVSGTLLTLDFTVDSGAPLGDYQLDLEDVLRDGTGALIPDVTVLDGTITVQQPTKTPDVNSDGHINVLDMILVGQHWGETGTPCWRPEDINIDGVINVLDMILIGQNWTG